MIRKLSSSGAHANATAPLEQPIHTSTPAARQTRLLRAEAPQHPANLRRNGASIDPKLHTGTLARKRRGGPPDLIAGTQQQPRALRAVDHEPHSGHRFAPRWAPRTSSSRQEQRAASGSVHLEQLSGRRHAAPSKRARFGLTHAVRGDGKRRHGLTPGKQPRRHHLERAKLRRLVLPREANARHRIARHGGRGGRPR